MKAVCLTYRLSTLAGLGLLRTLMDAAITELQKPFLDPGQIESSRTLMGLDTQLIEDGTYFVVEANDQVAGCGGWSRRSTLYGGDQTPGRNAALLDPKREPAKVRAMYTCPTYARQGVGRLILSLCESAARSEGFLKVELMATMSGEPLYRACGYEAVESEVQIHDLHATILALLGLDHEKLTYRYAGRDFRLTDVAGNVVKEIMG